MGWVVHKSTPIVEVKNWNSGMKIARSMLKNSFTLYELGKKSEVYYSKSFSPEAVSKKIKKYLV